MAIISHQHRLVFFPLAKNCSSSIKHLFYELETGLPFRQARKKYNLVGHVHNYYPSLPREKWLPIFAAYDSMVIVREPIKRFLSAYANRVVHIKALETVGTAAKTINASPHSLQPTLEEFVQNLEFYCEASPYIRNHVAPQQSVIGKFFPQIKRVYDPAQVPDLEAFLSERYEKPIVLPREQSGGPKLTTQDLSRSSLKKLKRFYKNDYAMLSEFYKRP